MAEPWEFNASGARGAAGDFSQNGQNGFNASHLRLDFAVTESDVLVGSQFGAADRTVKCGEIRAVDHFHILAVGGAGGNGGPGISGRDGANGRDGARGQDGGDGENGANGGNGGSGGHGGHGGDVEVHVKEEDAFMLLAIRGIESETSAKELVAAGLGGRAGAPGRGGQGGSGGEAGAPETRTSTYTVTVERTEIDEWGNRSVREFDEERHFSYTHYPSSGRGGKRGIDGNKGEAGHPGQPGALTIHTGGERFSCRFDLLCERFLVEEDPQTPAINDGLLEPGGVGVCREFVVQNPTAGSMPTPTQHQCAELCLERSQHTRPLTGGPADARVFVGPSTPIPALASEQLAGTEQLRFRIDYPALAEGDAEPTCVSDRVCVKATQFGHQGPHRPGLGFERSYPRFADHHESFSARFPVCNHGGLIAFATPSTAELSWVRLDLENISQKALGESSARAVVVRWTLQDGGSEGAVLAHSPVEMPGRHALFSEVQHIPANGGSAAARLLFGWQQTTPPFGRVNLLADICLQAQDGGFEAAPASLRLSWKTQDYTVVQRRLLEFECLPAFEIPQGYATQPASALVVYPCDCPRQLLKHVLQVLHDDHAHGGLALPTAHWNMSRYGCPDPAAHAELGAFVKGARTLLVLVLDWTFKMQAPGSSQEPASAARPLELFTQRLVQTFFAGPRVRILVLSPEVPQPARSMPMLCPAPLDPAGPAVESVEVVDTGGCCTSWTANDAQRVTAARGEGRRVQLLSQRDPAQRGAVLLRPSEVKSLPGSCCRSRVSLGQVDVVADALDGCVEVAFLPLPLGAVPSQPGVVLQAAVASLPQHGCTQLLAAALQSHCGPEQLRASWNEQGVLHELVGGWLHQLERDCRGFLADWAWAPTGVTASVDELLQELEGHRPALPSVPSEGGSKCEVVSLVHVLDTELKLRGNKTPSGETGMPLVDTPLRPVQASQGDGWLGQGGWHFEVSSKHQALLLKWSTLMVILHAVLCLLTLGIWYLLLEADAVCCRRRARVVLLSTSLSPELKGPGHVRALSCIRELLCGVRLLREEYGPRSKTLSQALATAEARLQEVLLPATTWTPAVSAPGGSKAAIEEFLKRRRVGMRAQLQHLAQNNVARLFSMGLLSSQDALGAAPPVPHLDNALPCRCQAFTAEEWAGLQLKEAGGEHRQRHQAGEAQLISRWLAPLQTASASGAAASGAAATTNEVLQEEASTMMLVASN